MDLEQNISTSLAILELVEDNTHTIDDCKSTVGVFIDLNTIKRPDTVDHNNKANKWVCSYLEKRSQYV